jgi:hypothetical protein
MWIHADQEGVPRDKWAEWFISGYPAEYWPKPGQHPDHQRDLLTLTEGKSPHPTEDN